MIHDSLRAILISSYIKVKWLFLVFSRFVQQLLFNNCFSTKSHVKEFFKFEENPCCKRASGHGATVKLGDSKRRLRPQGPEPGCRWRFSETMRLILTLTISESYCTHYLFNIIQHISQIYWVFIILFTMILCITHPIHSYPSYIRSWGSAGRTSPRSSHGNAPSRPSYHRLCRWLLGVPPVHSTSGGWLQPLLHKFQIKMKLHPFTKGFRNLLHPCGDSATLSSPLGHAIIPSTMVHLQGI